MHYDWILFDADNTLMDFTQASHLAFHQMLEEKGIAVVPDHYATYKTCNNQVWSEFEKGEINAVELRPKRFRLFLEAVGMSGDPHQLNKDYLDLLVHHSEMYAGAYELLGALSPRAHLAIITNGLKEVQRPRISKLKIDHFFKCIVVSDEIGHAKPQAGFFDYTFQEIGHPPKEKVLVVGDSLQSDIKGGNNYGLDTCWYNPKSKDNPTDIEATYEINTLEALIGIIPS